MNNDFENLTPNELAAKVFEGAPGMTDKVNEVLTQKDARFIQLFMHRFAPQGAMTHWFQNARVALDIRLAEEAAKTAGEMIKHTEKLTLQTDILVTESKGLSKLTKVLIWITVALGVFAVIQIGLMVFDIWKHE